MSPEEFIYRIMEAEPPEIYLMEDLKKPFTEASMMMSLTNLADKELVFMISWAKKIPGEPPEPPGSLQACRGCGMLPLSRLREGKGLVLMGGFWVRTANFCTVVKDPGDEV